MRGSWDYEQLFVGWHGIWLSHEIVAIRFSIHHISEDTFSEVAGMCFLSMHNEYCRTDFVDVIEETCVGVSLAARGAPTVVRIARTLMIATWRFVIGMIVFYKLRCILRQWVNHAASHSERFVLEVGCKSKAVLGLECYFLMIYLLAFRKSLVPILY